MPITWGMSITSELPEQYLGDVVPVSYNAGFICLSYFISLVGAMSTLELVSRRTSHKGIYNHILLVGAAISMGGISIWSMHYIGNRAIYIHQGEDELQIVYSAKMTVISLFLPILVLLLAFVAVSSNDRVQWWRIGLSGFLSGSAIVGMHYLGNLSVENYRCEYSVGTIVGAALIAVVASTAALALFFVLQAAWTISWWRKILCAMLLAAAVSGMHWCGAVGTRYRLLRFYSGKGDMSRETTIVVVICLSIAASIILVASAVYSARTRMRYATKAQQIALAAAVFDGRGRILVNQEGLLPSQVITDTILQKSDDDVFGIHHPLFHWMFRVSRNWPSVTTFLDAMSSHTAQHPSVRHGNKNHAILSEQDVDQIAENYDLILREHFCLAASALASKTNETLPGAGVLWDEIFPTGAPNRSAHAAGGDTKRRRLKRIDEAEKGMRRLPEYSRGSLMFLVRHIDSARDAQDLENAGYRFVDMQQVVGIIVSSMQIQCPNFSERLSSMAAHKENLNMLAPGVHLGMFAIRARVDYGGFDVLVDRDRRNVLPAIQLPRDHLEQWQLDLLGGLDGLRMSAVVQWLDGSRADHSEDERKFRSELRDAVVEFGAWLQDPIFEDAVLISKVIRVPCSTPGGNSRRLASLITFKLVLDIHDNANRGGFDFIPLQLFKVQQLVYEGSPHRLAFSHDVHRELSSILAGLAAAPPRSATMTPRHGRFSSAFRGLGRSGGGSGGQAGGGMAARKDVFATSQERLSATSADTNGASFSHGGDQSSFEGDAKLPSYDGDVPLENLTKTGMQQQQYGGIMVSQQITVNVHETSNSEHLDNSMSRETVSDANPSPSAQMDDSDPRSINLYSSSGNRALNVEADKLMEKSTFVDELMALCMSSSNARL